MAEGAPDALEQVQITLPLHFQRKVLQDIYTGDGLVILARGLGLPSIVANLLHSLNQPGSLVILLGAERTKAVVGDARGPDLRLTCG